MTNLVKQYDLSNDYPVIGIPTLSDNVNMDLVPALLGVKDALGAHDCEQLGYIGLSSGRGLFVARNEIARIFLSNLNDHDWTHLFYIDPDVIFDPTSFLRVLAACRDDRPIVAGVVPDDIDGEKSYLVDIKVNEQCGETFLTDSEGLLQVNGVDIDFMCIQRRVIEHMALNMLVDQGGTPILFTPEWDRINNILKNDAHVFCEKAQGFGFTIHIDPSLMLGRRYSKMVAGSLLDGIRYTPRSDKQGNADTDSVPA